MARMEVGLPAQYEDLQEPFNKQDATQLCLYQSYNYAINLLPRAIATTGCVLTVSQPESEA